MDSTTDRQCLRDVPVPEHQVHIRLWMTNEAIMDYEVFYINDAGDDEYPATYRMLVNGASGTTTDLDKAEMFVHGCIKWDGCSHNNFGDYIHGCSREDMTRLGPVFTKLFDLALEMMPEHGEFLSPEGDAQAALGVAK